MLKWLQKFKESNRETKYFVFNAILWTAAIVLPTIYCYARLDYVRSVDTSSQTIEKQK